MYVLKFRGAGQGPRALIAELLAGEIGRALGLPVPELVLATLDPDLARTEPDREIHALILDSAGLNLGMDYLPGSVTYNPVVHKPDPELASRIVWFDSLVTNVDRTVRNTNMLWWHKRLWLIDHGATLYFHHAPGWQTEERRAYDRFPLVKEHVLLRHASRLGDIDAPMAAMLTPETLGPIVEMIPDRWLSAGDDTEATDVTAQRASYLGYLVERLTAPRAFVEEAIGAR